MKFEIAGLYKKLRAWSRLLIHKAKFYSREWINQVIQTQTTWYQEAHDWIGGRLPSLINRYDRSPNWFKRGLFYLPWLILVAITLNYFNVFDRGPAIKSVQNPNVVEVNQDLRKMIADGKIQVAPFVEELRTSG